MLFRSKKPIALASFPRSGNTWLRFLIEDLTGTNTGSVYNDRVLNRGRNGIVVKTHEINALDYKSAIYVIRHPADSIISYYHWKKNIAEMKDVNWDTHFYEETANWKKHVETWLYAPIPKFVLKFEDFKKNEVSNLKLLAKFLDVSVSEDAIKLAIENCSTDQLRKKEKKYGDKFFNGGESNKAELMTEVQKAWLENELKDLLIYFRYID